MIGRVARKLSDLVKGFFSSPFFSVLIFSEVKVENVRERTNKISTSTIHLVIINARENIIMTVYCRYHIFHIRKFFFNLSFPVTTYTYYKRVTVFQHFLFLSFSFSFAHSSFFHFFFSLFSFFYIFPIRRRNTFFFSFSLQRFITP